MRLRTLMLVLTLVLPVAAGFVPPDDTKVLFRRDLLPMDTDTMRALSSQLTELARRDHRDDPAQLRATAQLLAVASRLDPVNQQARGIGRRLADGRELHPGNPAAIRRAKSEIWHLVDWLLHKEAGAEGQLLGNQLLDALRVIDPKHPAAARQQPGGEADRWEGVVAPLDRFRDGETPAPTPPGPEAVPAAAQDPAPPDPLVEAPPILLRTGKLQTPLIIVDRPRSRRAEVLPLTLSIQPDELAARFEFQFQPEFITNRSRESALHGQILSQVRAPLLARWKALPPQNTAVISTDGKRYSTRNGTSIAGPAALLVHASLVGETLRDDLVFMGVPQADGSLVAPANPWELLNALRRGPGGRLLVPPDLQGALRALLVLGDPQFFVRYEVLAVRTLDEAVASGSAVGDPEELAGASAQFLELRRIASSKPISALAANPHVRTRLEAIQEVAPDHLSARMLLLQGSGQRPTRLDLPTLRQVLIFALDPIDQVIWSDPTQLTAEVLEASYARCRKRLDPVGSRINPAHRQLGEEALGLANTFRSLARLRKNEQTAAFTELHIQLKAGLSKFLERLGVTDPASNGPPPGQKPPS